MQEVVCELCVCLRVNISGCSGKYLCCYILCYSSIISLRLTVFVLIMPLLFRQVYVCQHDF